MSRVKRGATRNKKRERLLQHTKGFRWQRKSSRRAAKQAVMKAWTYQYRDRRRLKRDKRALWNVQINAAARANNTTYSALINGLKRANVELDRKVLADIAEHEPEVFTKVTEAAK
jgi:large subunit ribosomal protein L20